MRGAHMEDRPNRTPDDDQLPDDHTALPRHATSPRRAAPTGSLRRTTGSTEAAYALLLAAGIALPFSQAVPWLVENGPDLGRLLDELFATRISSFFGWDVIVTVVALLFTVTVVDTSLTRAQRILTVLASLLGASVGLPLYLLLRQRNLRRGTASPGTASPGTPSPGTPSPGTPSPSRADAP
ncbi:DUF2834 domain-containing protein [Streptomyces sp. NPDC021093]|uniref:DUF2834 domain-containing protein n=1 Tax=Streptomyces sp. NPDC021093 TaxID=3365112 RepID=UPI0037A50E38